MERSPIQSKKQGKKKSNGGGDWEGSWTKFEKRGVDNIGGLHKTGVL